MKTLSKKGIFIPVEILHADTLNEQEIILLSTILSLSKKKGYCYASNEWLASCRKVTEKRIANMISSLRNKGWLSPDNKAALIEDRQLQVVFPSTPEPRDCLLPHDGTECELPYIEDKIDDIPYGNSTIVESGKSTNLIAENPVPKINEESGSIVEEKQVDQNPPVPVAPPGEKKVRKQAATHAFIDEWKKRFREQFEIPYVPAYDKDGPAAKRLVAMIGNSEDGVKSEAALWRIVEHAWKNRNLYHCKQATTIRGFAGSISNIRIELNDLRDKRRNPATAVTNEQPWMAWKRLESLAAEKEKESTELDESNFGSDEAIFQKSKALAIEAKELRAQASKIKASINPQ